MANEIQRIRQDDIDIVLLQIESGWASIEKKFRDNRVKPGSFPDRNIHEVPIRFVRLKVFSQDLHGSCESCERISDFMRHACRHFAERRQPFAPPHLLFKITNLSQVLENSNQPRSNSIFRQRRKGHPDNESSLICTPTFPFETVGRHDCGRIGIEQIRLLPTKYFPPWLALYPVQLKKRNILGSPIERGDPACFISRKQSAAQTVHNIFVESL